MRASSLILQQRPRWFPSHSSFVKPKRIRPRLVFGVEWMHDGWLTDVSLARISPFSLPSTGTLCFVRNVLGIRNSMVSFKPRTQQIIKLRSSIRLLKRLSYWEHSQIPSLSRGIVRNLRLSRLLLKTVLLLPTNLPLSLAKNLLPILTTLLPLPTNLPLSLAKNLLLILTTLLPLPTNLPVSASLKRKAQSRRSVLFTFVAHFS